MTLPRFTVRQLDAFIAAAELGHFSQAARRLHLTASAISAQIAELEASLGFSVFERTTRKVVLTAEGRAFLPAAIAVQRQLATAVMAAADVRDRAVDVVRIAAPLTVAATLLPPFVAAFQQAHAQVRIRILDTGVEWLSDRVAAGEADLAIGPDRQPSPDVDRLRLYETPWVAWCAPDHPIAANSVLRWEDAVKWPFFAAGRDHEHSVVPRLDPALAAAIEPAQVVDNITTALGLAAAGLGFTCSPAHVAPLATAMRLVMRKLVEPVVMRELSLYHPRSGQRSPSAGAVKDALVRYFHTLPTFAEQKRDPENFRDNLD